MGSTPFPPLVEQLSTARCMGSTPFPPLVEQLSTARCMGSTPFPPLVEQLSTARCMGSELARSGGIGERGGRWRGGDARRTAMKKLRIVRLGFGTS
jgi:hypothetical protein